MSAVSFVEIQQIEDPGDFYYPLVTRLCEDETGYPLHWNNPAARVYGAFTEGKYTEILVGMSQLCLETDRSLYIARMAVVSDRHRTGIGSVLMNHAVGQAIDAGCDTMSVQPTNNENEAFYQAHGFSYDPVRAQFHRFRIFRDLATEKARPLVQ